MLQSLNIINCIQPLCHGLQSSPKGSFKRYVTPEGGGREGSKLYYEPLRKSGGGERVSVMPLRSVDKFFCMAKFTRNLPIGSYSLYYLTSKNPVNPG